MRSRPLTPALRSRRNLLTGLGAGLVAGSGFTELGDRLTASRQIPYSVIPPGESLMYEHGILKRVLLVYQNAAARMHEDLVLASEALLAGAGIIHEFIEGFHEALEEGYVFPTLRSSGILVPTVDTLLVQHARGREITQLLLTDANARTLSATSSRLRVVAAVDDFVRMYQPHEAREDTVVFPAFRAAVTPSVLEDYGRRFLELQSALFGSNGFSSVLARVVDVEVSLGINDLASFTAPASATQASSKR